MCSPSGEKATVLAAPSCAETMKRGAVAPISQSVSDPPLSTVATSRPSGETATERTSLACGSKPASR
jgi:hypothetical protein